jgi:hypothetical protein
MKITDKITQAISQTENFKRVIAFCNNSSATDSSTPLSDRGVGMSVSVPFMKYS